jgi:hypothetical protein
LADWVTISSLATAGGTLVLAAATFSSVRSSNRSARVAERSLLAAQRPVLIPSREADPPEGVSFVDHTVTLQGQGGVIEVFEGRIYMAIGLRNGGSGLAVLHGWSASAWEPGEAPERPELERFRRQQLDVYIPAGGSGLWRGAIRDPDDPDHAGLVAASERGGRVTVDLLYGDHEGGQRMIARFGLVPTEDGTGRLANVLRYWNIDRPDPR